MSEVRKRRYKRPRMPHTILKLLFEKSQGGMQHKMGPKSPVIR